MAINLKFLATVFTISACVFTGGYALGIPVSQCTDTRAEVADYLKLKYNERSVVTAVLGNGKFAFEMLVSDKSWSVIIVKADGYTCLVWAGEDYNISTPAIKSGDRDG